MEDNAAAEDDDVLKVFRFFTEIGMPFSQFEEKQFFETLKCMGFANIQCAREILKEVRPLLPQAVQDNARSFAANGTHESAFSLNEALGQRNIFAYVRDRCNEIIQKSSIKDSALQQVAGKSF